MVDNGEVFYRSKSSKLRFLRFNSSCSFLNPSACFCANNAFSHAIRSSRDAFSFSFLAHSVVCCKSLISAFLSALFADKSHVDSCDGRRPFFADNFGAAEIILLAKMGKQKLHEAIFSVRCSRRFFSRPQKWAEKRSEFFGP